MLDHATGIVVGETAVIEDDVSILQSVTTGGTGKTSGDRHPKIREGVMIGAGAKILGNIEVGRGAKSARALWCCSPCRRTPPPLAYRRASSVSQTVINHRWTWISTSTVFTIRLSMVTALTSENGARIPHLAPGFIHHHGHGVRQVHAAAVRHHRNTDFLLSGQGVQNRGGRPRVSGQTSDSRLHGSSRRCARACLWSSGQTCALAFAFQKRGVIMMANHRGKFMIIQPRTTQAFIIHVKPIGSIICRRNPVLAHRRIMLPVLGGISGSNKTMLSMLPLNCGGSIAK